MLHTVMVSGISGLMIESVWVRDSQLALLRRERQEKGRGGHLGVFPFLSSLYLSHSLSLSLSQREPGALHREPLLIQTSTESKRGMLYCM